MKIRNPLKHKLSYFAAAPNMPPHYGEIDPDNSVDLPEFSKCPGVHLRLVILGAAEMDVPGNSNVALEFSVKAA
jgi:hypothetical protein